MDYNYISALVTLVVAEAETSALRQCLDDRTTDPVASDLARVESFVTYCERLADAAAHNGLTVSAAA